MLTNLNNYDYLVHLEVRFQCDVKTLFDRNNLFYRPIIHMHMQWHMKQPGSRIVHYNIFFSQKTKKYLQLQTYFSDKFY